MTGIKTYEIPLNGISEKDLESIKLLIERHAEIFEGDILAPYGGDAGYSVVDGSFEVIGISDEHIDYIYSLNHFAGCRDLNSTDQLEGGSDYYIENNNIIFDINETVWQTE
ncbi:TPA: hypothetical protein PXO06_002606 [Yersinia enterocolitica]|uniref:hypothetical protein n=1 Tax=Yersinia enterocolitica TaxID=630 RepID=UPI0020C42AF6|nr:hypothetical protein [Yersinia enterocolitica]HDL6854422.1 hypothetical protein [Yersinia enterocolitica]HDL6858234.1 hypothetical protein [Yersinia enterocolitica]HDL6862560.1 hypothetical protein [Yersinia enterocolitica]HDL6866715.1 hypothetical protein [Yersinia enterocolitica]HDL6870469.1 hypothetical protein [Yersinia enterocolitica]